MANSDVIRWGTDPSGRPILLTQLAAAWLNGLRAACKARGFTPTVVQGSFMARLGGGASASAGYHDQAGAIDFRTRDLTEDQQGYLVREARRRGGAAYLRGGSWDKSGMDPHMHVTLGWDAGQLDAGLAAAWRDYLMGGNGLTGRSAAKDPHWRPVPLVLTWSPPPRYVLTRGQAVDHALKDLRAAKGSPERLATIAKARQLLRSLKGWRRRA